MTFLQVPLGTLEGLGPYGQITGPVFTQFEGVISSVLGVLTVSGGLWFIFQIFAGALQWLSSGGEKQALQNAQKRIATSIAGLLIVVLSYTFIAIIGSFTGLNILNPFDALQGISAPGGNTGGNNGGNGGNNGNQCAPGIPC